MNPESAIQNIRVQKWIALISVSLFALKVVAYFLTNSVSILTDALESTVNVVAAFLGLYSLILSAKPRDEDHPYGHGKVEFISSGIEGALVSFAGLIIIYEAILNTFNPHTLYKVDQGIYLIGFTALINFIAGWWCIKLGKKNNSLPLISSGKHLQSDTYSTLGIILGLILIYFTGIKWIDNMVAMIFGFVIIWTGIKIVRSSIAGIMDETDRQLLEELVEYLNNNRRVNWIDLHNLRVIKYGSILHIDCHLTVPNYFTVDEAHVEVNALENKVREKYGDLMELFVHVDGCLSFSCPLCTKENCSIRNSTFKQQVSWTVENISSNKKHSLM